MDKYGKWKCNSDTCKLIFYFILFMLASVVLGFEWFERDQRWASTVGKISNYVYSVYKVWA